MPPTVMHDSPHAARKFHTLDGLRGIAALAVVFLHYRVLVAPIDASNAYLAVDLFFGMSGIVIAYAYEKRLATDLRPSTFMLKRWVRLYPLYLLGFAIAALPVVAALGMGANIVWTWSTFLQVAVPNALMLPSASLPSRSNYLYGVNFPAWSLFYELISNFIFAAFYPWMNRRNVLVIIGLSSLGLLATAYTFGNMDAGAEWAQVGAGLSRVLFSFFVGVLIYRARAAGRLWKITVPAPALVVVVGILMMMPTVRIFGPFGEVLMIAVAFPLILIAAVQNEPTRMRWAYEFGGPVSYPLYVLHIPVLQIALGVSERVRPGLLTSLAPASGIAFITGLLFVSWAAARYYDPRVRPALGKALSIPR